MTGDALNRDAFLAALGSNRLAEEVIEVPRFGAVLARELSGAARAQVLAVLAPAASGGEADFERYQEMLLELGLVDPVDEKPILDMATVKQAMAKLGGSQVEKLCGAVERLSGLDKGADARAEGNSEPPPSSSTTTG